MRFAALIGLLAVTTPLPAQAAIGCGQNDEKQALRRQLRDEAADERWIYDDLDAGFAEAKKSGKPLFVVLRCVP
jgi:hypothetical protein